MWNDLTMQQRADVISMAVKAGMRDMKSIRSFYDETSRSRRFEDGGNTKASIPILSSTPKLKFDAPVIEKVRPEYEEIKPKEEIPIEPIKPIEQFRTSNGNYLLANGGHLFADGGIKKYTGDSEDIGYDANSMKFYERATGKELGDSAILDEVIVNGRNRINDYLTEANDNTSVYNVPHREYNLHLKDRAEQGAREAAIWREEHPTMSAWGDAAASVPLAVASVPLIAGGAEALAGTSAGQAISSGLLSLSNLAKGYTIAGAPAWAWADAGLTSAFGAHGIDELSKGNVTPGALLEVAPLGQLAKPLYKGVLKSGIRQYNPRHVIKQITAENAASITPEQWTAAQDAAIARGDMAEAQRLSNLHGEINGYKIKGSHASKVSDNFTEFNTNLKIKGTNKSPTSYYDNRNITAGAFFGDNSKGAINQFGKTRDFLLRIDKPLQADAYGMRYDNLLSPETTKENIIKEVNNLRSKGYTEEQIDSWIKGQLSYTADDYALKVFNDNSYDGAIIKNIYEGHMNPNYMDDAVTTTDYIITKPHQAKLMDAVTYDDNGIRIPLGERHNFNINDIRYGLLPFGIGLTGLGLVNEE